MVHYITFLFGQMSAHINLHWAAPDQSYRWIHVPLGREHQYSSHQTSSIHIWHKKTFILTPAKIFILLVLRWRRISEKDYYYEIGSWMTKLFFQISFKYQFSLCLTIGILSVWKPTLEVRFWCLKVDPRTERVKCLKYTQWWIPSKHKTLNRC